MRRPAIFEVDGTCYVTRQSVHTPASIRKAKKAIRLAFENAMAGKGTSLVEVVSGLQTRKTCKAS